MKKIVLAAAIILVGILIIGGYIFYSGPKPAAVSVPSANTKTADSTENKTATENIITDNATKGTLPSIQTNPLEEKPDLNPVDKTNPYKNIKTNPFK